MGNNLSCPTKSKGGALQRRSKQPLPDNRAGAHPSPITDSSTYGAHPHAENREQTVSRTLAYPASMNPQTQLLKPANSDASHPTSAACGAHHPGTRNNTESPELRISRRHRSTTQSLAHTAPINSQTQVSDEKSTGSTVIFHSTSHHGSSFNHINKLEIYDSTFTIENPSKSDLERLHPSQRANHKTVLEEQVIKREECTVGTRVKILEDITKWANDSSSRSPHVFWLTGQAGSGKTTIAYTIAKQFENSSNADLHTVLGSSFLCSRQFEETRELIRIVPTIAYQLARKCKPYADALRNAENFDAVYHDVPTQLEDLLVEPWQFIQSPNLPLYLIIVDALDEINGEGGSFFLRDLLTAIDKHNLRGFKFLVTSRPDSAVVMLCKSFTPEAVRWLQHVPIDEAELDIGTYLKIKLPKLAANPKLDELTKRAGGLFIYAATVVKYLTPDPSITIQEQTEMLGELLSNSFGPASSEATFLIDELYRQIMRDKFSQYKGMVFTRRLRILHTFLCTAERTSTSVVAALVAEAHDDVARAVAEDLHAVLYIQGDRVFWYHASFPDFIFDPTRSDFDNFQFSCNELAHHDLLVKSCFRVMKSGLRFNIGDIESSFLFDNDTAEALSHKIDKNVSAVLEYSSRHWVRHLPSPGLLDTDNIRSCISEFLEIRVLFWIEAMNLLKSRNQCTPMLRHAREWVLKCGNRYWELARDVGEAANFANYFTGSPAAESTPHLYISALATWSQDTSLSRNWKKRFTRIPVFIQMKGKIDVPLMTIVTGHNITSVAFSNDGLRIVSGSWDRTVRVWDASTGAELNVLKGHTSHVTSVALSEDCTRILSGSSDTTMRLWDASTGAVLNVLKGHTESVKSIAFSRDGMRIVSGSGDTVRTWDTTTGAELNVLKGHVRSVSSVAFSMDGERIVSGSQDQTVRMWDASTGAALNVMKGHTGWVNSVAFSRDGKRIVSGSLDQTMRIWDAPTGAVLNVLRGRISWVNSVAFSGDGKRIASGSLDKTVQIWDASTSALLNVLTGHTGCINSVAFSRDGMRIVSGSHDNTLRVWDASVGARQNVQKGHTSSVYSVGFSRDGLRIVSGSYDGTVRVWDASTGAELNVLTGHTNTIMSVAFSTDGKRIVSGSYDETVRVWDASTGEELNVLTGHTNTIMSVAFSTDGKRIVSGSLDKTVRVWDALTAAELSVLKDYSHRVNSVAFWKKGMRIVCGSSEEAVRMRDVSTGGNISVLKGHTEGVYSVAFSRDGMRILSGSADETVRVWDASAGTILNVLKGHTDTVQSVSFSMDGLRIVSGSSDGTVRMWDSSTGANIDELKGHTKAVYSVAFSRDGMRIVSGSKDMTVREWDVSTGAVLNVLNGHTKFVNSVTFSRDGRRIVSGSDDGSVRVWDASTGGVINGHTTSVNFDRKMKKKETTFSSDGTPFADESVETPSIRHRPPWNLTKSGWIISQERNHLMWVPPEAQVIEPPAILIISRHIGFSSVNFQQSKMGIDWAGCYTP